ncbi:hypothetical protein [Clavibacter michiganensis]|uniref:hypothetical protein n=1 Tax=Clavibacter michiganensis TaxID=28447 RepID=UPI001178358D|nr:hypothetical protein [Clavibacter michiganensis]
MVDARFPERYLSDRRIARLTADEFRSYFMATLWGVSNRTDGRVEHADVALIPHFRDAADRLVELGLWQVAPDGTGWIIDDFKELQTSAEQLEAAAKARKADADKKKRQRSHAKGEHAFCGDECDGSSSSVPRFPAVPGDVPGDGPGDLSRGQDRRGQDRQGQKGWPTAAIPAGDESCWACGGAMDSSGHCVDPTCPQAQETAVTRWAS